MAGRPLALAHPDWLYQELTVTGEERPLRQFQAAATGAGVIPWVLDYDRLEEDWFHLLVTPSRVRTLSLPGARALARQLREAVWERHEEAVAGVGSARFCPFDLHALVPVPRRILRLGPDEPESRAWLWENWGTTWPPRHVRRLPGPPRSLRCGFWTADWTPWRALQAIRQRYPALRFAVRVVY
ncbi:MAG: hypothetical protein JOZ42_08015 [Acetobacteraceae bacterium]|nr:hypothetical protein [Acetobacteraceae bacterium]